jgi:hypothetical protein
VNHNLQACASTWASWNVANGVARIILIAFTQIAIDMLLMKHFTVSCSGPNLVPAGLLNQLLLGFLCRHEEGRAGHLQEHSPRQAGHDVLGDAQQGYPAGVQEVHARCKDRTPSLAFSLRALWLSLLLQSQGRGGVSTIGRAASC